jgi:hypothetical protein
MKDNTPANTLAVGIAIALVIGAAAMCFVFTVKSSAKTAVETANGGYELFKRVSKDLYIALQFEPRVTVRNETVHGPAVRVEQIVTAAKDFKDTYSYEVSWAGSIKKLELTGEFRAKAGFTLNDSMEIEFSDDGKTVTLRHGEPELISCELTRLQVGRDESGWWNKLQPKDREAAQNELLRLARSRALDVDLKDTAIRNLVDRLKPLEQKYSFSAGHQIQR